MTEELLNVPDIGSLFKQMCRKAVPQSMYCGLLSYVCFRSGFFEKLLYASRAVSTAGSGLYMDESATMSDLGKLDGGNIIGYDPYDKKLHWFSVDNFGTTHDHI